MFVATVVLFEWYNMISTFRASSSHVCLSSWIEPQHECKLHGGGRSVHEGLTSASVAPVTVDAPQLHGESLWQLLTYGTWPQQTWYSCQRSDFAVSIDIGYAEYVAVSYPLCFSQAPSLQLQTLVLRVNLLWMTPTTHIT